MISFSELPDDFRMKIRDMITNEKGIVEGYYQGGIQIIMPNCPGFRMALKVKMQEQGFQIKPGSVFWFPACNNEPLENLRWKTKEDEGNRCAAYVENTTFHYEPGAVAS